MLSRKPRHGIMITGVPRSGSTILANVLALSPTIGYVEEPFNSQTGMIGTDDHFFPYIYKGSKFQKRYDAILDDILAGRAHYKENQLQPPTSNPLRVIYRHLFTNRYEIRYQLDAHDPRVKQFVLKDPTASLSSQHFINHPNLSIIYTLRHPCGVVASHQRLGWVGTPIQDFLNDPKLYKLMSSAVQAVKGKQLSEIDGIAWYWRAVNELILHVASSHPDTPIVEHEAFSQDPEGITKQLYQRFDIPFTHAVETKLKAMTSTDNPTDPTNNDIHVLKRNSRENIHRWKKYISKADEAHIMKICGQTYSKLQKLPNTLQ